MLDRIISFSLRNRISVAILALLVVIGGCFVASRMETDVFPDLNAPTVAVMTEAPGLAPEEVERLVTFPVETSVNGVEGVRRIRSSSVTGFSIVWVEFDWDTEVYRARQNISERLMRLSGQLPSGVGMPVMGAQSSVLGEVMFIGLTSDSLSLKKLRRLADAHLAPRLRSLKGVAQVSVIGGAEQQYQIILSPMRMREYGVTLSDVLSATQGMNANPTGTSVYEHGNEYLVKGIVSTADTARLAECVVKAIDGEPSVKLGDVAEVRIGDALPIMGSASVAGKEGVIMTVSKQPSVGTISLTETLDEAVDEMRKEYRDVDFHTDLYRQKSFIDSSVSNIRKSLVEGAVFVCIILFIFLMNPRTTLISLVTIPLSLLMTLMSLHLLGLTINTMSIGGIAIAIGSLVDDAIVDVENVYKRLRHNAKLPEDERKRPLQVVFEASREVRMPILNSTMIIIVSFVPLFFLSGMEGRMLVPLGVAFILALVSSTIVALTLTPVLCSWLLPNSVVKSSEPRLVTWLRGVYSRALEASLRSWRWVLGGVGALLVVALAVFFMQGRSFLPPFNEGSLTVNVSALPGISFEESDSVGALAERILLGVPEIRTVARKTGRAELDEHALGINVSEIEAPFELGGRSRDEFMEDVRHRLAVLPGVNIEVGQPISHRIDAMLSGTQSNVAIKVFGTDLRTMHEVADDIREAISGVDGLEDLNVEQQVMRPQIHIVPRREVMAEYGLTMPEFTSAIEALGVGVRVSEVYEDNLTTDIVVKLSDSADYCPDNIGQLPVNVPGGMVPLENVAEVSVEQGPGSVGRENLERRIVVSANVSGRDLRGAVDEIREKVESSIQLPAGYRVEYGGQFESEQRASRVLLLASLASLVAIFMLLYNQFRSWLQSVVVMLNLPLALIGGVFAVAFTSGVVSIPAIIGFISLFGIATRNGMLLVDRYNELIHSGMAPGEAVRTGSLDRLNPIVMTALTSALALIPLAAGASDPGNEIQSPMAKVILGGLVTSTLLNGFVIPIMYLKTAAKIRTTRNDSIISDSILKK